MIIKKLVLNSFHTNTYIVAEGGDAVVIDPAGNPALILAEIEKTVKEAKLKYILLTHGHFDHISAAADLKQMSGGLICIHENDEPMLSDADKSFAAFMPEEWKPCRADELLNDNDIVTVNDKFAFKVIATPGHSGGSVIYAVGDVIFSGDTLFEGSVGRIDGWSGNHYEQMNSLERIKAMQGNYRILPGHGDETTLEREKRSNPFLIDL
ncbi:MAG: MBL fold metallo-hydrolase [Oscillospiraceae bacterium]|nr:MBL fold metallo-hydrolase [Oscillospiraceae bacterium]